MCGYPSHHPNQTTSLDVNNNDQNYFDPKAIYPSEFENSTGEDDGDENLRRFDNMDYDDVVHDCDACLPFSASGLTDDNDSCLSEELDADIPGHPPPAIIINQEIRDDIEILVDIYLFFEKYRWTLHSFLF